MENKVKERREELHMSQVELSEKAGVSRQTVYALETNKANNITMATMLAIAHALESTVDKIFL